MKLPGYRRIITQDFPKDNHELVEQIGSNINDAFNSVYSVLNKRVSLADNIACTVREVLITVDSDGDPVTSVTFSLDVQNTPVIGCLVVSAVNVTNTGTYPTSAPWVSFTQNANTIIINNITGLQANNLYRLKIVALN